MDRQPELFRPTTSVYCQIVRNHDTESDIVDEIDASLFDTTNAQDIIRIRNSQNDDLFPFNARAFIKWYEINPTHPLTRENLNYLRSRIDFKKQCMDVLEVKQFKDITLQYTYSLLELFGELMSKKYGDREALDAMYCRYLLECQAYIDLSTLEVKNMVHRDMNFREASDKLNDKPPGSWLLRKSSRHDGVMKNAEIVVLAWKSERTVYQNRLLNVHGVGWFKVYGDTPVHSFQALQGAVKRDPDYVTLCHAFESYCGCHFILWDKLIIP
jgi:hypothetical protein